MKKWTNDAIGDWVLYKNNQLIAFNKPAGLPVQGDRTGDKSLLDLAAIYTKGQVELIHRLDRPASGLILMAKNKKALAHLNQQFKERQVDKAYLAVVQNRPEADEGTLDHYVQHDKRKNQSRVVTSGTKNAKSAQLSYRYLASSDAYHLLEVRLFTGRHHQIRVQLAAIDCPIKGDVKYGARRKNPDRSIHLHAWKLGFKHPVSGQKERLTAPVPTDDPVWHYFASELSI